MPVEVEILLVQYALFCRLIEEYGIEVEVGCPSETVCRLGESEYVDTALRSDVGEVQALVDEELQRDDDFVPFAVACELEEIGRAHV